LGKTGRVGEKRVLGIPKNREKKGEASHREERVEEKTNFKKILGDPSGAFGTLARRKRKRERITQRGQGGIVLGGKKTAPTEGELGKLGLIWRIQIQKKFKFKYITGVG